MISQLSLKKRVVFALSVFLLIGQPLSAKKYKLSGVVVGTDGEPVKKAQVSIVVDGKTKKEKTNRKGIFKFCWYAPCPYCLWDDNWGICLNDKW